MNKTYEEILDSMKAAYFKECGKPCDYNSNTVKRLEAVASELFALSCYGDYIFRQAFIQTATKENLDRHGAVRDCVRKSAAKASGFLTFYVDEPAAENINIGNGTVCSVAGKPYLQYATTQDGAIESGQTSVTIPAIALGTGYSYNANVGTITVMVNAPIGISGVRNDAAFSGGYDDESDSSYRERIMKHYSVLPNGVNTQSVQNAVMMLDFVTDCYIPDAENGGEITVVTATKSNSLSRTEENQIKQAVGIAELTGSVVNVQLAQPQGFSLSVELHIRSGFDKTEIEDIVESTVNELCSSCRIGREFVLSSISKQLVGIDGISSFYVYSNDAYGEVIPCGSRNYLYLEDMVVRCFD
ncbi:MAG: baseplate J/gp47 family protein [Eubacterium sp.]|nr:baseplate J/gp47 family protein [Eubacterium sp.]